MNFKLRALFWAVLGLITLAVNIPVWSTQWYQSLFPYSSISAVETGLGVQIVISIILTLIAIGLFGKAKDTYEGWK